jgi:GTP cyclohydrolase I
MEYKKDRVLGKVVRDHLNSLGVETPFSKNNHKPKSSEKLKAWRTILSGVGLNLKDASVEDTPDRLLKLFDKELFWGMSVNNFPKITTTPNDFGTKEMVMVEGIDVTSVCEHHFLPIIGKAKVAYIPTNRVVGLSKLNRVVEYFSARPQVQERLGLQIFETLKLVLETEDVAVQIKADHYCTKMRGVKHSCSSTTTTNLGGSFYNGPTRNEFLR